MQRMSFSAPQRCPQAAAFPSSMSTTPPTSENTAAGKSKSSVSLTLLELTIVEPYITNIELAMAETCIAWDGHCYNCAFTVR